MAETPVLIILAGGASSRMWPLREKSLLKFGEQPLLQNVFSESKSHTLLWYRPNPFLLQDLTFDFHTKRPKSTSKLAAFCRYRSSQ